MYGNRGRHDDCEVLVTQTRAWDHAGGEDGLDEGIFAAVDDKFVVVFAREGDGVGVGRRQGRREGEEGNKLHDFAILPRIH